MSENKYLKFEEDNEYKENLDREFERLNKGEISKEEFLDKHINRHNALKSMSLEEYKNLPLIDHKQSMLDAAETMESAENYLNAVVGPYRMIDRIPNKREDNTGVGAIMTGTIGEQEGVPEVRFTMNTIDVVFEEE